MEEGTRVAKKELSPGASDVRDDESDRLIHLTAGSMQCSAGAGVGAAESESAGPAQEQGYTVDGNVGGIYSQRHPPPGLMFKAYRRGGKGAGIVWRARCCACAQCACPEGACSCTAAAAGCEPCGTFQSRARAQRLQPDVCSAGGCCAGCRL